MSLSTEEIKAAKMIYQVVRLRELMKRRESEWSSRMLMGFLALCFLIWAYQGHPFGWIGAAICFALLFLNIFSRQKAERLYRKNAAILQAFMHDCPEEFALLKKRVGREGE